MERYGYDGVRQREITSFEGVYEEFPKGDSESGNEAVFVGMDGPGQEGLMVGRGSKKTIKSRGERITAGKTDFTAWRDMNETLWTALFAGEKELPLAPWTYQESGTLAAKTKKRKNGIENLFPYSTRPCYKYGSIYEHMTVSPLSDKRRDFF